MNSHVTVAMKKCLGLALLLALLLPGAGVAADEGTPTLAFLSFGQSPTFALTQMAVMDMLEVYGYISAEERGMLEAGRDLEGENINILYRDAGFDMGTANLMVEDALDEGADVLLTISNEVGMLAAAAMSEMDDPPPLIFTIVTAPYDAGLASAPCVKPPNVTGTQMYIDFALFDEVQMAQNPDMQSFGMIINSNDPGGARALEVLGVYAALRGFMLEVEYIVTPMDYPLATEALLDKGVDAIVLPPRTGSSSGISSVAETAYGVVVYSALVTDVFAGITVGAGFQGYFREGVIAARMLIAHLRGELDIATTAINTTPGFAVGVNVDSADANGVELRDELLEVADFVVEDSFGMTDAIEIPGVNTFLEVMSMDERMALDAAFLADLHCTPEMIAEQQAQLDAGG